MLRPRPETDWKAFAGPSIWLLLAVLLGAGLAWAGAAYRQEALAVKQQREAERGELEKKHENNQQARDILEKYYVEFNRLRQNGFIGQLGQQRLILGRRLEDLKQARLLPFLNYKISGWRDYPLDKLPADFKVSEFTIELRLGLLHEGELLRFLDLLDGSEVPGLFNVKSCRLNQAKNTGPEINLYADCIALWYTVDVDKAKATVKP